VREEGRAFAAEYRWRIGQRQTTIGKTLEQGNHELVCILRWSNRQYLLGALGS
jgi:hypothetical protein